MDPVADFAHLMRSPRPRLDLALALVAAAGRDEVDPEIQIRRLDDLAENTDCDDACSMCAALFGPGGFRGDTSTYYDPQNSLIDRVLDRRAGIPITLASLAIEVGRRRGVDLVGIGMPGHFLLRDAHDRDAYFDAFHGGSPLDTDGVGALFAMVHRGTLPFRPEFLAPDPPLAIVARVLNNLRAAYSRAQDRQGVLRSLTLQAELPGAALATRRDLATAMASVGRLSDAADQHDRLAVLDPAHQDDHALAARRLRAQLN